MSAFITAHGGYLASLLFVFTALSLALTGVASALTWLGSSLQSLGVSSPPWIGKATTALGTAISWVGTVMHFFNGNTGAATASASPTTSAPAAPSA